MHRLFAVIVASLGLSLAFTGMVLSASPEPRSPAAAVPAAPAAPRADLAEKLDLYMSTTEGGPHMRGFPSSSSSVVANLSVEGATNERFLIRQRDLSGIVVKEQPVGPLNGSRTASATINATDFVNAYRSALNTQTGVVTEKMDESVEACKPENIPPVPDVWPPTPLPTVPPGQPTPVPQRDYYGEWMTQTLESVEIARTATAGVTRTLQSILTLPDIRALDPANTSFTAAQTAFRASDAQLAGVAGYLKPVVKPGDPPVRPDPTAGCNRVRAAKTASDQGLVAISAGWSAVPADTSAWRIPPTGARYTGQTFMGCQQYTTDVYAYVGNNAQGTATKSVAWTVGDAGPAALLFTGPDLADRDNLGVLDLSFPTGFSAIFAKSVTVPGTNHMARLSAFVTDSMCNPVDGAVLTYAVTPAGAATLDPIEVAVQQGVPMQDVVLQAGDDGVNDGLVTAKVKGVTAPLATGRATFQVVGPADRLRIVVKPDTMNLLIPDNIRAGISVVVRDEYGRNVANNTRVHLQIADRDPGKLAYYQLVQAEGRTERTEVILGKSAELVTVDGYAQLPVSEDPGVQNRDLHILADVPGSITLSAEADGKSVNTDENGQKTIHIIRQAWTYLPLTFNRVRLDELPVPRIRH